MNKGITLVLCTWFDEEENILSSLPLELIYKIVGYADERTTLEKFVEENKDYCWDWGHGLSANPSITSKFVEKYPNCVQHNTKDKAFGCSWNWGQFGLSVNPSITQKFILENLDKPWEWGRLGLSVNPVLTPEFVELLIKSYPEIAKKLYWGIHGLSSNPSITPEFIKSHPDKEWFWGGGGFSSNPGLTQKFILESMNLIYWGKYGLSKNPVVTPEFVEFILKNYPIVKLDWGSDGLSSNPNITKEFVKKHINEKWTWGRWGLSKNSAVTPDFVKAFPDKPWEFGKGGLSSNPSITQDFILENIKQPWALGGHYLSDNPAVTPEFVEFIMKNCLFGVKVGDIESFQSNIWEWGHGGLSHNPNITLDFIRKHPDKSWKVGLGGFSTNTFDKNIEYRWQN